MQNETDALELFKIKMQILINREWNSLILIFDLGFYTNHNKFLRSA